MGRDKLSLPVGGVPLVRRVYDVLALVCEEVLVVASEEPARDYGLPARTVADLRPGREGPLAAMEAGLAAARNDHVFVAAGDAPFVSADLVGFLLERVAGSEVRAAVPRYGGRPHPLCAAYERDILADLSSTLNLGVRAVREFLESLDDVTYVEDELERFGDPETFLMNVNSPEDLEKARSVLGDSSGAER